MKLQKVVRVIVMLLIGIFVFITLGFSLISTSTGTSVKIEKGLILNGKLNSQLTDENDVETNYSESVKRHNNDFLNLNVSLIESESFTPVLYRWLWENSPTQ